MCLVELKRRYSNMRDIFEGRGHVCIVPAKLKGRPVLVSMNPVLSLTCPVIWLQEGKVPEFKPVVRADIFLGTQVTASEAGANFHIITIPRIPRLSSGLVCERLQVCSRSHGQFYFGTPNEFLTSPQDKADLIELWH